MDIADIRKKAKAARRTSPEAVQPSIGENPPAAPPRAKATTAVSPTAEPVATVAPAVTDAVEGAAVAKGTGRRKGKAGGAASLDELFDSIPDLDLATEEGYQHGLERRDAEADEDRRRFLTFSLGLEEYALDIVNIREIIKPREITDIPRVPGFLLGIISLRGSIIPIFDLKSRLKLGTGAMTGDARIVVCNHGQRTAGLLVDRISQVVTLSAAQIEPPPAVLSGLDRDLVEGVGRQQGKMMILLQMESVLNAELT